MTAPRYVDAVLSGLLDLGFRYMQLMHGPLPPRGKGTGDDPTWNTTAAVELRSHIMDLHGRVQGLARALPFRPDSGELECRLRSALLELYGVIERPYLERLMAAYPSTKRRRTKAEQQRLEGAVERADRIEYRIGRMRWELQLERHVRDPDVPPVGSQSPHPDAHTLKLEGKQARIYDLLKGHCLSAREIAQPDRANTTEGYVRELIVDIRLRLNNPKAVIHKNGYGFYRPDAPPEWAAMKRPRRRRVRPV